MLARRFAIARAARAAGAARPRGRRGPALYGAPPQKAARAPGAGAFVIVYIWYHA